MGMFSEFESDAKEQREAIENVKDFIKTGGKVDSLLISIWWAVADDEKDKVYKILQPIFKPMKVQSLERELALAKIRIRELENQNSELIKDSYDR